MTDQALERSVVVGVIGAGAMGAGIAQVAAQAGHRVLVFDARINAADDAKRRVGETLAALAAKGKLAKADAHAAAARIEAIHAPGDAASARLVVEAIVEDLEAKRALFRQVENVTSPDTILATNTSSISITQLAAVTQRPGRFLGMHFFNPVPMMALVELIRGLQTSDATVAAADAFAKVLGKTPITVKNSPGFVVNRILCPMLNEAIFLYGEGVASAKEIDEGMKLGCNHPLGPLALTDMIGLDVLLAVMEVLYTTFNDPKYRPAPLLREMVDAGLLGRKSGRGFYTYEK